MAYSWFKSAKHKNKQTKKKKSKYASIRVLLRLLRSAGCLLWSESGTKLLVLFSFTQKNIQSNQNISAKVT
ncbi:hypothetical protein LDENG_00259940 [Lucifuga dentata]|nr:hypothetical protein LDENG_00259940 [Lucifuga dentata]